MVTAASVEQAIRSWMGGHVGFRRHDFNDQAVSPRRDAVSVLTLTCLSVRPARAMEIHMWTIGKKRGLWGPISSENPQIHDVANGRSPSGLLGTLT